MQISLRQAIITAVLCIPSFVLFAAAIYLEQINSQMWGWILFFGFLLLNLPWMALKPTPEESEDSEY